MPASQEAPAEGLFTGTQSGAGRREQRWSKEDGDSNLFSSRGPIQQTPYFLQVWRMSVYLQTELFFQPETPVFSKTETQREGPAAVCRVWGQGMMVTYAAVFGEVTGQYSLKSRSIGGQTGWARMRHNC